jgi:hypothetical protein
MILLHKVSQRGRWPHPNSWYGVLSSILIV